MKKLIAELESEIVSIMTDNEGFDIGYKNGMVTALEIVKAHNPWISVTDGLPSPHESHRGLFSIDVSTYDGVRVQQCCCNLQTGKWFGGDVGEITGITHWTYLPEVQP